MFNSPFSLSYPDLFSVMQSCFLRSGIEYIPAGSFSESVASTGVSVVASLRSAGGFGGGVPLTNQEIEEWLGDACNNIIKVGYGLGYTQV